jgi:pSer/pThr/pTyr-binding forkhead associated (FHA) protein
VAIADPQSLNTEAPMQETGSIPRVPERERQRAVARLPQIAPGRYLGIEDAGEIVLIPLAADVMHIGRSPAADVVLDDSSVSRRHALIARRGEVTVILDDRSLNGIHVNGERVKEATLSNGDVIVVGQVSIRFIEVPA